MHLGKKVEPAKPAEPPEWIPHPNGRQHLWIHRGGVKVKYLPPSPYAPIVSPVVVPHNLGVQEADDDLFWVIGHGYI